MPCVDPGYFGDAVAAFGILARAYHVPVRRKRGAPAPQASHGVSCTYEGELDPIVFFAPGLAAIAIVMPRREASQHGREGNPSVCRAEAAALANRFAGRATAAVEPRTRKAS